MILAWILGCAPSLLDRPQDDGEAPVDSADTADTGPRTPLITTTDAGGGVYETVADATEYLEWTWFSFATGEEALPATPETDTSWDLGFERYLVQSNGGVSGVGGVVATALPGQDFDALTAAPSDATWTEDLPDDDDENQNPEYALGDWFDYASEDHAVTPSEIVWVVRAVSGTYYKLEFTGYYDDSGTPAWIRFRWAQVAAPE